MTHTEAFVSILDDIYGMGFGDATVKVEPANAVDYLNSLRFFIASHLEQHTTFELPKEIL